MNAPKVKSCTHCGSPAILQRPQSLITGLPTAPSWICISPTCHRSMQVIADDLPDTGLAYPKAA